MNFKFRFFDLEERIKTAERPSMLIDVYADWVTSTPGSLGRPSLTHTRKLSPLSHTHTLSLISHRPRSTLSLAHTCSNKGRHTLPPSSHTPTHSPLSHAHTYSLTSTCPLFFTHTLSQLETHSPFSLTCPLLPKHTLF